MGDALPSSVMQIVMSKMDASDCARASCVDRRWHEVAGEESLWKFFCLRDFSVSSPVDAHGNFCGTFKSAYWSWRKNFKGYALPLVMRAKRCLDGIKDWLRANFVEALDSLHPGVSFAEIHEAEKKLGFELPGPVRLLYSLCDGQSMPEKEYRDFRYGNQAPVVNFVGLLGGYSFYDHLVNVHLLPLRNLVNWTLALSPVLPPSRSKLVVIGLSFNKRKIFFLDCEDGQVYVGTKNLEQDLEMIACTPRDEDGEHLKDSMLRWLEHYSHCLHTGMYSVGVDSGVRSISLFPITEPRCTEATTRGVQVRTSAVFVPELTQLYERDGPSFWFAYSVCMRLLNPEYGNGGSAMTSTQLVARHWIIRPDGLSTSEVRGAAVIGQYPYLQAGGQEFVYQSCSALEVKSGSIEGDFTFVPGRIANPTGAEFTVFVAPFPLEVPDYIF